MVFRNGQMLPFRLWPWIRRTLDDLSFCRNLRRVGNVQMAAGFPGERLPLSLSRSLPLSIVFLDFFRTVELSVSGKGS